MEFEPMSPEERERMMQFLLSQQAQFAADFAKSQERMGQVERAIVGLAGVVGQVADNQALFDRRQQEHDQRMREFDERMQRASERQDRADEHLRETRGHLDMLIEMFEKHLREDHGVN